MRTQQAIQFLPLSTFKQVGLAGFLDCSGSYFIINISAALFALSWLFIFIIILNYDASFDVDNWQGSFNGTLSCEKPEGPDSFVQQPIAATTSYLYVFFAVLALQLGAYDIVSWRERTKIWRETNINGPNAENIRQSLRRGRDSLGRNSLGRSSLGRNSVGTVGTSTTFSAEHEAASYNRRYNEYVMGKKGSPSLFIRQPIWSVLFGVCLTFLGCTGFLFHASLTNLAKRLDVFGLWVLVVHLIAYSWTRFFADGVKWKFLCIDLRAYQDNPRRSSYWSTMVFLILAACADFGLYIYLEVLEETEYDRAVLLLGFGMFVVPMFLHYFNRSSKIKSSWSLLVVSLFFMLMAYLFNEYDVEGGELCNPAGISAHAVWHVLSALGIFLLLLFFRSDSYIQDAPIDEINSPRLSITNVNSQGQPVAAPPSSFNNDLESQAVQRENLGPEDDQAGITAANQLAARNRANKKKSRRPSAIRGTIPQLSDQDSAALDESLAMKRRLMNEGPDAEVQVSVEQMWTCSRCNNTENSISYERCTRCGNARPNLDNMVVIPFAAPKNRAQIPSIQRTSSRNSQRSAGSKSSRRSAQSKQSANTARSRDRNPKRTSVNSKASGNPRASNQRTNPRASNQRTNPRASNQRTNPRASNQRTNPRVSNQRTNPRASNPRASNQRTQQRQSIPRQATIPQAVPINDRSAQRRSNQRGVPTPRPMGNDDDEDPPI